MTNPLKTAALALAVPGLMASALPVAAMAPAHAAPVAVTHVAAQDYGDRGRHNGWRKQDRRVYTSRGYDEPVRYDSRVWQGNDGRYYCQRSNGTTGLLIGGAGGALLGSMIAGRGGDRTLGAIIGGAGGALLGRSIDQKNSRCQ